ncbi:hypothetical protein JCM10450v2_001861 [Rhodotorula kratochvilovae]
MASVTGRCNCSAVSVELKDGLPESTILCHCSNCRVSSGSLFSTLLFAPRDRVVFFGEEHIQTYRDMNTDSGNVVRRHCPIYGFIEGKDDQLIVRATLFEPKTLPAPALELYGKRFEVWEKPHGKAAVVEGMPPGM